MQNVPFNQEKKEHSKTYTHAHTHTHTHTLMMLRGLMLKGRLQAGYFIIHSKIEKGDEISSIVYKPWKMEVSKLS